MNNLDGFQKPNMAVEGKLPAVPETILKRRKREMGRRRRRRGRKSRKEVRKQPENFSKKL